MSDKDLQLDGEVQPRRRESAQIANIALQQIEEDEQMVSSDTESDISIDSSSSSSDEDELPQPATLARRGRVRTRGGARCTPTIPTSDWVDWATAPFTPIIPPFTGIHGPTIAPLHTVSEYVEVFLTEELLDLIVSQTNLYARQFLENNQQTSSSRASDWKVVVRNDIKHYICLTVWMGIHSLPSITDYWSQHLLLRNPVYSAVMSRNRYQLISKFLHFADNTNYHKDDPDRDRLYKIRPILQYFVRKFQESYSPSQDISIDEQLLLHKGNLFFRQYIPTKRARFGIKFFSLCDSTGYLFNTELYTGKAKVEVGLSQEQKNIGKTGQIVMRLMAPILDKGHHLFVDNWYTSPALFRLLSRHSTPACGTVRKNRAKFPLEVVNRKMNQGEYVHLVDDGLLGVRYRDKRDVFFLSTFHRPKLVATRKTDRDGNVTLKDSVVEEYNQGMGFVDKNDAVTTQHTMVRKSNKWTTKVVFHLIEESLYNAYILYGFSENPPMTYTNFKLAYVYDKLIKMNPVQDLERASFLSRNTGQHFLQKCPVTNDKYQNPRRRCVCCSKKGIRRESRYCCEKCPGNPAFCVDPCFKEYHSK